MKYFVLKPESKNPDDMYAKASRMAMKAYASVVAFNNPDLATNMNLWVLKESEKCEKLRESERVTGYKREE